MMGSGGMVVVDDTTCMVDFAKFFLQFTAEESCGKCVPCRVGTTRMLEIVERITEGEATVDDVDLLEQLADDVAEGSLCALGGSAPNPVLSTLRYFRDELMAHVVEHRCPAEGLPGAHPIHHRRGGLHRLPRLRDRLPGQRHQRGAQRVPHHRSRPVHQVRFLSSGLPVRRRPGRDRDTRAR